MNPGPLPGLEPAPQPQPSPRKRRKPPNPWVMPWIPQRQEKGCYNNLLADLIHTDITEYQNFVRMSSAFFDVIEESIHHHIKKSVTNFRKSLEVGLQLAITLRHLATGETHTSLQYPWLVGHTTICKFVPHMCQATLVKFQDEYLYCPTSPQEWKIVEKKFRTRWNAPHAVGAIDRKHIAMKKQKKSDSDYYNPKAFLSLVLLALVDAEYRFLWIDCGSSGSCSDAQIFNRSKLMEMIEDDTLGLPAPEALGEGGIDLHYILPLDHAFALMPWMVKPYSRRQLTREERIANYRISRGSRVVANTFGILDIVYTWVVLHNMMRTPQGGANRAPTPGNDVAALQNEQAVYVPNENHRNSFREPKYQLELLKDYFNHMGALAEQEDRI